MEELEDLTRSSSNDTLDSLERETIAKEWNGACCLSWQYIKRKNKSKENHAIFAKNKKESKASP